MACCSRGAGACGAILPMARVRRRLCAAWLSIQGGGIALIFMRSDTRWFQEAVLETARALFLWRGRIRFCREDGTPGQAPNAASCLAVWDARELELLWRLEAMGKGKVAML